jgi:hypothetical protein
MKDKAGGPALLALGAAAVAVGLRENMMRRLPRAGRDYRSGEDSDQAPVRLKSESGFVLFAVFTIGRRLPFLSFDTRLRQAQPLLRMSGNFPPAHAEEASIRGFDKLSRYSG